MIRVAKVPLLGTAIINVPLKQIPQASKEFNKGWDNLFGNKTLEASPDRGIPKVSLDYSDTDNQREKQAQDKL